MRPLILALAALLAPGCARGETPRVADAAPPPASGSMQTPANAYPREIRYVHTESNGTVAPRHARSSSLVVDLRVHPTEVGAGFSRQTFVGGTRSRQEGTAWLDGGWADRIARLVAETVLEPIPERPATIGGGGSTVRLTILSADGGEQEGRPVNASAWARLMREVVAQAEAEDGPQP